MITKLNNLNCNNTQQLELGQKLKLGQNSTTQIVIKLNYSSCDKPKKNLNSNQKNSFWKKSLLKKNMTP